MASALVLVSCFPRNFFVTLIHSCLVAEEIVSQCEQTGRRWASQSAVRALKCLAFSMLIAQIFSILCKSKGYPPLGHRVGVSVVLGFSEWATCQGIPRAVSVRLCSWCSCLGDSRCFSGSNEDANLEWRFWPLLPPSLPLLGHYPRLQNRYWALELRLANMP